MKVEESMVELKRDQTTGRRGLDASVVAVMPG
jgi:hypothetical protein